MMSLYIKLRNIAVAAAVAAFAFTTGSPANAGNIFLTGHDTDFHFSGNPATQAVLGADLTFVRAGSSLPVLVFDSGTQLSNALTALGIAHTTVNPDIAGNITDAMFDHSVYSAIAVASVDSCGGCDNHPVGLANLATHVSAIGAFVTAGGGILGLAGAADLAAYAYVPEAASNAGGFPPSTGYIETVAGTAAGLLAENGDATHNFFSTPGTGGVSAAYTVAEILGTTGQVESVFVAGATVTCTGSSCTLGVPGPIAGAGLPGILLASGLFGAFWRRRRQQTA